MLFALFSNALGRHELGRGRLSPLHQTNRPAKGLTCKTTQNYLAMRGFLFVLAILLLVVWAIGLFGYALKGLFNIVIILALASFILGMVSKRK